MSDPVPTLPRDPAEAKAWFYLDHRRDIEEWAGLRQDAAALLHRCLIDQQPWFEDLAAEVAAEPDSSDLEGGSWPRLGLRRPAWAHAGMDDVSVVLQWERSQLLRPRANEWPFVAVHISPRLADPVRRQALHEAVAPVRMQLGAKHDQRWPLWRYVTPTGEAAALSPEELIGTAQTSFRQLWDIVAPALDIMHARDGGAISLDPASTDLGNRRSSS
jgi:hypothetical protein